MRTPIRLVPALVVIAMWGLTAACSNPANPTPVPTPKASEFAITSVAPADPVEGPTAQTLFVQGVGFNTGLVLELSNPTGTTAIIQGQDIQNVTATSFQASVVLLIPGAYSLVVRNPNAVRTSPFPLTVRPLPIPPPVIDDVSPFQAVRSQVPHTITLSGHDFTPSMFVQVVNPQGTLRTLQSTEVTFVSSAVIQFSFLLDMSGDYAIVVSAGPGHSSNSVFIHVQ